MNTPVYLLLIPVSLLAVGGLCFWYGRKGVALGLASKEWPSIQGTVTTLTPVHEGVHSHDGGELRWQLYARMYYEVGERRYWGDWKTRSARTVEQARKRCGLTEGGPITVYYDPADPRTYVIETGVTARRIAPWVAGGMFVAFSAVAMALLFVELQP